MVLYCTIVPYKTNPYIVCYSANTCVRAKQTLAAGLADWLTWLTEAPESVLLVYANAMHTRRRFALVLAVLAQRSTVAGRTIASVGLVG